MDKISNEITRLQVKLNSSERHNLEKIMKFYGFKDRTHAIRFMINQSIRIIQKEMTK